MRVIAEIGHWLVVGVESVLGHVTPGAMLNLIAAAAMVACLILSYRAARRDLPRIFDLALLVTTVLLLATVLHVYSSTSRLLSA